MVDILPRDPLDALLEERAVQLAEVVAGQEEVSGKTTALGGDGDCLGEVVRGDRLDGDEAITFGLGADGDVGGLELSGQGDAQQAVGDGDEVAAGIQP